MGKVKKKNLRYSSLGEVAFTQQGKKKTQKNNSGMRVGWRSWELYGPLENCWILSAWEDTADPTQGA